MVFDLIATVVGLLLGKRVALTPASVRRSTRISIVVVGARAYGPICSVVVGCGDAVVVGCLAAVIALLWDVVVVVVVVEMLMCDVLVVSHRSSSAGKIF